VRGFYKIDSFCCGNESIVYHTLCALVLTHMTLIRDACSIPQLVARAVILLMRLKARWTIVDAVVLVAAGS